MMRLACLLALTACNQAFDLAPAELAPPDAPDDQDSDGVADLADNCPAIANADQSDEDGDTLGDVCDNCPLLANLPQSNIGDSDSVGDDCDPHPTAGGDCLVLLDRFDAPEALFDRWRVLASTSQPPMVTPQAGSVVVAPVLGNRAALVARDATGTELAGTFDVQVLATVTVAQGRFGAVSNASTPTTGWACGVQRETEGVYSFASANSDMGGVTYLGFLSTVPAGTALLARLVSPSTLSSDAHCRISYGVAVGYGRATPSSATIPIGGGPGFLVMDDPAEIDAIAIYRFDPSATCAPVIR